MYIYKAAFKISAANLNNRINSDICVQVMYVHQNLKQTKDHKTTLIYITTTNSER